MCDSIYTLGKSKRELKHFVINNERLKGFMNCLLFRPSYLYLTVELASKGLLETVLLYSTCKSQFELESCMSEAGRH